LCEGQWVTGTAFGSERPTASTEFALWSHEHASPKTAAIGVVYAVVLESSKLLPHWKSVTIPSEKES